MKVVNIVEGKILVEYTRFYDEFEELVQELVDDDLYDNCGYCGGCYNCLMMQVGHYGWNGTQVTGERFV